MQYSIELYFDPETAEMLYALALRHAEEWPGKWLRKLENRPSLTLARFNDVDEQKCIQQLKAFAAEHKAIPAKIESVSTLGKMTPLFVSLRRNSSICQLHAELHECLKEYNKDGHEQYSPGSWIPNCEITLTGDEDIFYYKTSEPDRPEFRKINSMFTEIGLVKMTFPVEEIYTVDLCK